MLNMNCPSCGAAGRVPEDKINARLHCKKCLAVFHLTALGNPVMGPPPAAPDEQDPARRNVVHDEDFEQLIEVVKELPQKLLKPAMILASLLLVYGLYQYALPTSLNTRATQTALALTSPDPRPLQQLALPGTGAATLAWYASVRARHKEFPGGVGRATPRVEITNVNSDSARGLAEVTAIIREPDATSRASLTTPDLLIDFAGERAVEVTFILTGGGLRGWRVDGSRTLEAHQKSVSNELAKTGRE